MKKILILLAYSSSLFVFGQVPTSSKKWNETFKRYEYYDQRGKLVGYEKYNNSSRQWEYFSGSNEYKKRQVFDLDYPEITSADITSARAAAQRNTNMKERENNLKREENSKIVQNKYNELYTRIKSFNLNNQTEQNFINDFNEKVDYADDHYPFLESPYMRDAKINFMIDSFNELLEKYVNGPRRK